ncbi:MAG: hypothetical protein NTV01_05835, partial [Bacteroidia bacterium]|nr:hypothetical protein [Bacteroidia bacterium]
WKYGLEKPPADIKGKTIEEIKKEDELIQKARKGLLVEKPKKEIHFYELPLSEDLPEGGYEFEIKLNEKPSGNQVQFSLQTKGLDFLYQPALSEKEISLGHTRPENVINSYAAYYKDCPINFKDGKVYRTGKAFHIYRPRIEDSKGDWCWGDLNIDVPNSLLTVTIPQSFLDDAVYPVIHAAGLTFGYTSVGASNTASTSDMLQLKSGSTVNSGVAVSISWYSKKTLTNLTPIPWQGGLYGSTIAAPLSPQTQTGTITNYDTPQWNVLNFTDGPSLSGSSTYYACRFSQLPSAGETIRYYYDTAASGTSKTVLGQTYNSWPTSPTIFNQSLSVSLYCTYTPDPGIKTCKGLAVASVKTVNGLAVASVKSVNNLS